MKAIIVTLFVIFLTTSCAGLGIVVAGAVIYNKDSSAETATVNIQAKPENVFNAAIETITKNENAEITQRDKSAGTIKIKNESGTANIKVIAIDDNHTQLIVSSNLSNDTNDKPVLNAVFRVCKELNVECYLSGNK